MWRNLLEERVAYVWDPDGLMSYKHKEEDVTVVHFSGYSLQKTRM